MVPWTQCSRRDDWRLAEAGCKVNPTSSGTKHGDVSQYWWLRFRIQFREPVSQSCPILVQEHCGQDEEFVDEEFQHEEDVEDHSQCFVDWNFPPTYDIYIYINDKYLIEVKFFVIRSRGWTKGG